MIVVIKVLVQRINISMISGYAPQCDLDDSQKDDFYDSLIIVIKQLGEKKILVIAGGFNGHTRSNSEDCEDQHGGFGYESRNK